jgi:hypothetical protein
MKTDLNLNENLKDAPEELKKFIESFYREEGKTFLEKHANLFDLDADIAEMVDEHHPNKLFNEIVLAMRKYKIDVLSEIIKDLENAEHETIYGKEYVDGCERTVKRLIVHLQQKILGKL